MSLRKLTQFHNFIGIISLEAATVKKTFHLFPVASLGYGDSTVHTPAGELRVSAAIIRRK